MEGSLYTPDCLSWGWQGVYNLTSSYWIHRIILNIAQIKFDYMIEDIRDRQNYLETKSQQLVNEISNSYVEGDDFSKISQLISQNAEKSSIAFKELINDLLFKYADGFINFWGKNGFNSYSLGIK